MSEFQFGDKLTGTPDFSQSIERIHPAIGVVKGKGWAYVGVWIPTNLKDDKGHEDKKDLLYLITSERKIIPANENALRPLGLALSCRPLRMPVERWRIPDVEAYIKGATVEPKVLFEEIVNQYKKYVEVDDSIFYHFQALWNVGTYFYHLFNTYPYNLFGGIKRVGKTKCLTMNYNLAHNTIFSGNVSTSSLFRLIQNCRCTFLIDENEKLNNPDRLQDFRSLLLSGYKEGAVVWRTEKTGKDRLVPMPFSVFAPKSLANIGGVEDVLEDRCVGNILKRGKNREIVNREINSGDPCWIEIRNKLYILFLTYWKEVLEAYQMVSVSSVSNESSVPYGILSGRELELWNPIFAMAHFFDTYIPLDTQDAQDTQDTLLEEMKKYAQSKAEEARTENMTETGDYILAKTLVEMVNADDYYKVKDIHENMASQFDEQQKWLSTDWIGRAMKRLGFKDKRRVGKGVEYKLKIEVVKDVAERIGIEEKSEEKPKGETPKTETSLEKKKLTLCADCVEDMTKNTKGIVVSAALHEAFCEECGKPAVAIAVFPSLGTSLETPSNQPIEPKLDLCDILDKIIDLEQGSG